MVAFHFFYAFTPGPFADKARTGFTIFDTPLAVLWNGHFAVSIFFVLSGFVLAASAPKSAHEAPLMISLRYLRLGVPALVSSILAWAWLNGFPDAAREAQAISTSTWFRWTYQPPIPPLSQAIWEGGVGVFLNGTTGFNNPLWTMRAELLGSVLIYGSYGVLKGDLRRWAMVVGIVGFAATGLFYLAAFCGGALVFEFRGHLRDRPRAGLLIGFAGLVIGATYPYHASGPGLLDAIQSRLGGEGWRQAGAVLALVSVLTTPVLRRFFDSAPLQRLGALSFPIYLVHVPLIVAPAAWFFVAFAPLGAAGVGGLFVLVCLATLALASVFLVTVERPLLAGLKAVRARARTAAPRAAP
ncbi:acyltransferase [Ancylobacter pratisalsi]|uniref:Acyltransferase n=1 Tax=Ancylobacter pratisalsi TaxID=1745854 RepID=A0A6P1YKI5_9HYPH|nr:acyltransferase [Ancylobacter pratisalsi]